MLMVQRHRLKTRDPECSTTARHQYKNVGLDDRSVDDNPLRTFENKVNRVQMTLQSKVVFS
jgi:hypothetical protein